jgi:DNA-binding response OmpR family regulator
MTPTKVLIVDDEQDWVTLLEEWLEDDGYEVVAATRGEEALRLFFQYRPALTITDLRMPGLDGFQLITRIREMSDGHILVLTALEAEEHVVRGFNLGADEYLVKPVSRISFLARVRAILRRAAQPEQVPSGYADAVLSLNFLTREAKVRGQRILNLRPTEFRLLAFLCQNHTRVVSHQELLDRVWGEQGGSLDSLKWYIHALREKIEEDPRDPKLIVTVSGVGYRYRPVE